MATLQEQVQSINERLRAFGIEAVQEIKMTDKGGNQIGQIKYGYRPQYVFDSVNEVLGPENWRYELTREEIFDNQAVAEVRLFVKSSGVWLCKRSHKAQMQISKGNVGDAQKGAITDAIQKCMSLLSIGSDAYKGLLKHVGRQETQTTRIQAISANSKNVPPVEPSVNSDAVEANLPKIAGVRFEERQGVFIALGDKLFDKKELLKAAGFQWDKTAKAWLKKAA